MQRAFLLGLAAAVGVVAIFLAVRELTDTEEVVEPEEEIVEVGGARTVGVRMRDIAFVPENVSIRAGQTVRWTNDDRTDHTVTGESGTGDEFDSGDIAPGETYDRTFVERGVYEYVCTLHPNRMRAKVTVLGD